MTINRGDLILSILRAAKEQGHDSLLTTALMKYLYLADVYAAEATEGSETLTGARWRFLHFGPYAAELQTEVDRLLQAGMLADRPSWRDADEELGYRAYTLTDDGRARSFEQLDMPRYVRQRLPSAIRRYGSDLSELLPHVYFETLPMAEARPRADLDFSNCRKVETRQFKAMPMRALSKMKIKRGREAIRALVREDAAARESAAQRGSRYDEVYWNAIRELDDDPLPIGGRGRAKLG